MTCADKLRDLHAAGTPLRNTAIVWKAVPEIAAVIEAAEKYINTLDLFGMADDTPIADALAALARRLETQP